MKNRSLLASFLLPFLITIITIASFYAVYSYFETKQRLVNDIALSAAKTDAIKSGKALEELYKGALDAMRRYSGNGSSDI